MNVPVKTMKYQIILNLCLIIKLSDAAYNRINRGLISNLGLVQNISEVETTQNVDNYKDSKWFFVIKFK